MANYAFETDTIDPKDLGMTDDELKMIFVKNFVGSYIHDQMGCQFFLNKAGQSRLMKILKNGGE